MLGDILLKIEKMHEFVEDCASNGSLSLIDKDIILQNLRDIYLDMSSVNVGDLDSDFEDDFENENIVLFDSKNSLKQIENIDENTVSNDPEVENVIVGEPAIVECDRECDQIIQEDISQTTKQQVVCSEPEEQVVYSAPEEEVVYMAPDQNDLEKSMTEDQRSLIISELCGGDETKYNKLINDLYSFTDLDECLIYISEQFADNQNSASVAMLADKMAERLV
ncbi:MAG: hypothetical protein RR141_06400 [Rikenellaceae bacterium]